MSSRSICRERTFPSHICHLVPIIATCFRALWNVLYTAISVCLLNLFPGANGSWKSTLNSLSSRFPSFQIKLRQPWWWHSLLQYFASEDLVKRSSGGGIGRLYWGGSHENWGALKHIIEWTPGKAVQTKKATKGQWPSKERWWRRRCFLLAGSSGFWEGREPFDY